MLLMEILRKELLRYGLVHPYKQKKIEQGERHFMKICSQ